MRKRLAGLCRESPFTALASAATFALQMIGFTINQLRRESMRQAGQRAASLLNIMALWDDSTIISCYVKTSGDANGQLFFLSTEKEAQLKK